MSFVDDMSAIVAFMTKIGPAIPQIEQIMEDGWAGVQSGEVSIGDFITAGKEAVALYKSFQPPVAQSPSAPPVPEPTVTAEDLNEQQLWQIAKFGASVPWATA